MNSIIKKYTTIRLDEKHVDDTLKADLSFGDISGYYDSFEYPRKEFDTEEEALNYLKEKKLYGNWIIVPIYSLLY